MIVLDLSILNQKGTPMFNSDLTANRPAAGIVGRIFIAIDSPYGIFRDTGTAWDQISSAGGANTNIYNTDGTLTGTRTVSSGGFQLVFNPQTTFFSSLIPSTSASSFAVLGSNTLTFAAGFSSSNIGNVYSANGAINAQIFSGNATFAQANLASAMVNVNKIDFGSGGHTITMTQSTAPGIRAMTGVQNQIQFTGSHNGTISHAAISQNLGFFRDTGSTRTLTITNAYSHLINPLDDYGAGFTFTNRWGIYQAGASDKNYFAANSLFGTTTDAGFRVDVNGTARVSSILVGESTLGQKLEVFRNDFGLGIQSGQFQIITGASTKISLGQGPSASFTSWLDINNSSVNPLRELLCNDIINSNRNVGSWGDPTVGGGNGLQFAYFKSTTNSYGQGMSASYSGTTYDAWYQVGATNGGGFRWYQGITEIFRTTIGRNFLIGTSTDVASSILTIESTTKGFLPPRMTNAQRTAIGTPAVGLIVYCTDAVEGLYIYKSTGWTFII